MVVSPPDSIQAAINNATAGHTILVSPGTYYESLEVNKSITLIGKDMERTIIAGQNNRFIVNISADNVDIENFTITINSILNPSLNPSSGINIFGNKGIIVNHNIISKSRQGIALTLARNNTISDNMITANTLNGIAILSSSDNVVSDNIIINNTQNGISSQGSNTNAFSGNTISGNNGGFNMYFSSGNTFSGNTLDNALSGDVVSSSTDNLFYDNNFYDTVLVDSNLTNRWSSIIEGNYWSNYSGQDRGDGIGVENYNVSIGNVDYYPLMGAFSSYETTLAGTTHQISIISNSSISDFRLAVGTETGNKIIQFHATGAADTIGFSRIAIPKGLMSNSVFVLAGEKEIAPTWLAGQNGASDYLYFTYPQADQTILVISSKTLDLYNQLLSQYAALNATYYGLLSNYTSQADILSGYIAQLGILGNFIAQLQTNLSNMSSIYDTLLNNYVSLLGNYSQLQQIYSSLNYGQNVQNVRSIMYVFAAATAILILVTVYFSKRAFSRPPKATEEEDRF